MLQPASENAASCPHCYVVVTDIYKQMQMDHMQV